MQITRTRAGDFVDLELDGRLDGYWCDHLTATLSDVIRDGGHHIRIDCAQVSFLSSAGVSVLVKFYRELARLNGTFRVVNPSHRVSTVLRLTRLDTLLMVPPGEAVPPPTRERPARQIEAGSVALEVFDLDRLARLTCRAIGSPAPLVAGAFGDEHCASFDSVMPAFAVGIGAFGGSFSECRARFGELISVAGATAYQPGDGTNVADYLVTTGGVGSDIRLLYCLACEGRFSHLIRFEAIQRGATVGLSRLLTGCLDAMEAGSLGIVIVAETSGIAGGRATPLAHAAAGRWWVLLASRRAHAPHVHCRAGVCGKPGARRRCRQPRLRLGSVGVEGSCGQSRRTFSVISMPRPSAFVPFARR